jgi:hypothetical protein
LIRGTKRKIDKNENVTRINPTVKASIHNRFDIEVVDAKTGEVKQKAYAENVILDAWWDAVFSVTSSTYSAAQFILIGGGQGIPSHTDTDLFRRIGKATNKTISFGFSNNTTYYRTRHAYISETEYVGETITEIGLAGIDHNATLTTHAMLKDMNGNQISIYKTDTDIINFYATVFVHLSSRKFGNGGIDMLRFGGELESTSSDYNTNSGLLSWASGFSTFPSLIFGIGKSSTAFMTDYNQSGVDVTREKISKTITCTSSRLSVNDENGEKTSCWVLELQGQNKYNNSKLYLPSIEFVVGGDWYPGTLISKETIGEGDGTTTDYSTKFSYAFDAKIYVNGVEQTSGVSVSNGLCATGSSEAGEYLTLVTEDSNLENIYREIARKDVSANNLSLNLFLIRKKNGIYCVYNPNYKEIPVSTISYTNAAKLSVYGKTETDEWTFISSVEGSSKTISLSEESKNYAFYKLVIEPYSNKVAQNFTVTCETPVINNIHFDEPPPAGSIITADYFSKTIAKDENHVFDFSATIQLGEYTGE